MSAKNPDLCERPRCRERWTMKVGIAYARGGHRRVTAVRLCDDHAAAYQPGTDTSGNVCTITPRTEDQAGAKPRKPLLIGALNIAVHADTPVPHELRALLQASDTAEHDENAKRRTSILNTKDLDRIPEHVRRLREGGYEVWRIDPLADTWQIHFWRP